MRSPILAILLCLAALPASAALAQGPRRVTLPPPPPVAVLVDGVKVGSTETFAVDKTRRRAGGPSCSSCTLMVTY